MPVSPAALGFLLISVSPVSLFGKGETSKIVIQGPGLRAPIELTEAGVRDFSVWAGPGVAVNGIEQTEGFIIDWVHGPVAEPASILPIYELAFYVAGLAKGLVYVVYYAFDADSGQGFVYLPGRRDWGWRINGGTMYHGHGLEGHWFRANRQWKSFVTSRLMAAQQPR